MKMKNKERMPMREALRINRRALKVIYQHYPQMVLSHLIAQVWKAVTPYVEIYMSALIIGELSGNRDAQRLKFLILVTLAAAAVIGLGSALLSKWADTQISGKWYKYDWLNSEKMLDMDFADIDDTKTHDLLSTIRQNQNSGGWGISKVVGCYENLVSSVFIFIGGIALTVTLFTSKVPESAGAYTILNYPLFVLLIAGVMLAVTYIAPALSNKAKSYWAANAGLHRLGNRLFSFFGWLGGKRELAEDVRMYRQDIICDRHNSNKEGAFCSKGTFARLSKGAKGLYMAAASGVSVIFTGIVYAFVCLKALAGAFGLGSVTQYVASVTKAANGVSSFISSIGDMQANAAFLSLNFKFVDIPNSMYKGTLTVEKRRDRKYEVEFRNVSFRYPNTETNVLHNVSLKFRVGERLAVVGMNGSGKTTFIKLLCRLYDPTEGEILLNGIDIRKYNYQEYMSLFAVVFQDFKLFSLKLGENVASGTGFDNGLVTECLQKVGFGERLAKMPKGLDTYLYTDYDKDGVNVSGGEGQKIAIARALYKNAPFIILDEPTAALDPVAEAEVYSKFDEIAGDKTAVYISHRLSSCKFCDEIAVFHEGKVVQQGTHESLVSDESGKYYELWNAQAQYYTESKAEDVQGRA